MSKYDPLERYLTGKGGRKIELGFAEIERIIGGLLPVSARLPQWWANEQDPATRHVQSRAWRNAGYEAYLIAGGDGVRFARRIL